jgi:hypothetical protein
VHKGNNMGTGMNTENFNTVMCHEQNSGLQTKYTTITDMNLKPDMTLSSATE